MLHAVDVLDAGGMVRRLAVRRFHDVARLGRDPSYVPAHEAEALRVVQGAEVVSPRLVAADTDAIACDMPALLTTRLPGRPPGQPRDMQSFLTQLAVALVAIHAVNDEAAAELPRYEPYYDSWTDGERQIPPWTPRPALWRRVFEQLERPRPATSRGFIHRDYHAGQTLWRRARLTGVVDWTTACVGPCAVDLARMQMNLLDLGPDVAERFLTIHRSISGEHLRHPYWDLLDARDLLLDLPEPDGPEDARSLEAFEDWVARAVAELG